MMQSHSLIRKVIRMTNTRLLSLCESYIDAVANANHMVQSFGIMSCYAFETQRQDIHMEICNMLNLDYGKVGNVLCDLENVIGLPEIPIDDDEFRNFKLGINQYAVKLEKVLREL